MCFLLVDASLHCISKCKRLIVVCILQYRFILCAMTGGDLLLCQGVVHILYTVAAEHQRPVNLRIVALCRHALIYLRRLVEFTLLAEMVCTVEHIEQLLAVGSGKCL